MKIYQEKGSARVYPSVETAKRDGFREDQLVPIELSPDILEVAYRHREREYLKEDAADNFLRHIGVDPDTMEVSEADNQAFLDKYGFSWDEAINEGGEHYVLDDVVTRFNERFTVEIPEYDQWCKAIDYVLNNASTTTTVEFGVTWTCFGRQSVDLPRNIDPRDRAAVQDYIQSVFPDQPLPSGEYVEGSDEIDTEVPFIITESRGNSHHVYGI